MAVVPLHGWSSHVGEVRLVVDPAARGRGIGRELARHAVHDAVDLGLAKLVVEVIADQTALIAMFVALGFDAEALLADHVRDRNGQIRDLLVLANDVESQFAAMATAGITERALTWRVDGADPRRREDGARPVGRQPRRSSIATRPASGWRRTCS